MRGIRSTALAKSIIDESLCGEPTTLLNSVENLLFSSSCLFVLKSADASGMSTKILHTLDDQPFFKLIPSSCLSRKILENPS